MDIYRKKYKRSAAKRSLSIFEVAMEKQHDSRLEIQPVLDDVWNVDDRSTGFELL
ncbi:hypothetical protein DCAR_0100695 [Daucus carota subsp. sativus]|uniref:Uncharacterized protein n=1 Tax=Daucus carota subsp. sativus TaxID=79200 RepID=A0A166FUU7_DAUCS|nr:hypothetical protein DCAR_0100695 [Daucus carota subsp. sativus]